MIWGCKDKAWLKHSANSFSPLHVGYTSLKMENFDVFKELNLNFNVSVMVLKLIVTEAMCWHVHKFHSPGVLTKKCKIT